MLFGINHPILLSQHRPLGLNSHSLADKFLHLIFQMQPLDEGSPHHGHHKPQNHIDDRHFGSKNPHQQHQTAQIHHGRGNKEGEGHPNRQSRPGKSHKERNGRTGTKGRHRSQEGRHQIGPHSPEPAQDLPASLRRKIALQIGDQKDQQTKQYCNFDHIIEKKVQASPYRAGCIHSHFAQSPANQIIEPGHSQKLILHKIPQTHSAPAFHQSI